MVFDIIDATHYHGFFLAKSRECGLCYTKVCKCKYNEEFLS